MEQILHKMRTFCRRRRFFRNRVSTIFWYVFVFALNSSVVKGYINNSQVFVNRVFGVLLIGIGVKVATIDN